MKSVFTPLDKSVWLPFGNQNKLMNEKHKKSCRVLNHIDHLPIVISTITRWVSIFAFASLVGIPIEITSSTTGLKNCAITAGIRK